MDDFAYLPNPTAKDAARLHAAFRGLIGAHVDRGRRAAATARRLALSGAEPETVVRLYEEARAALALARAWTDRAGREVVAWHRLDRMLDVLRRDDKKSAG